MAIITSTVANMHGGISHQPSRMRHNNQVADSLNATFSIVDGASKRNPLKYKHHISLLNQPDAKYHVIDRDDNEQYLVKIISNSIKVYDLHTGEEKVVDAPEGLDYLVTTNKPNEVFEIKTVADYSFICNKEVIIEMDVNPNADQVAPPPSWQPPNTSFRRQESGVSYNEPLINPSGLTRAGSVTIYADLPSASSVPTGSVYMVMGDENNRSRPYYVRAEGGAWIESTKPNIQNSINCLTMPWALRSNADGTFTFVPFSFDNRRVGDEKSNPVPSFVGNKIHDVIFHRNRLGFISGQNLILSRIGDFKTFFRQTVAQDLLADDMIDITSNSSTGSDLEYAIPTKGGLLLFSKTEQHLLDSSETLSPTKLRLNLATSYRASNKCEPVNIGSDVYFTTPSGVKSKMQRYFIQGDTLLNNASNITAHVPDLLDDDIFQIVGSSIHSQIFSTSRTNPDTINSYNFHFNGDEQVQSAWGEQKFIGHKIVYMHVIGGLLYVISEKSDGVFVSTLSIDRSLESGLLIDNRTTINGTYNDSVKRTSISVDYDLEPTDFAVFDGDGIRVNPVDVEFIDGRTISITTDLNKTTGTLVPYTLGNLYDFKLGLSEQFIRDSRGAPVNTAKALLKSISPSYTNSHDFNVSINPYGQENNQWTRDFAIETVGTNIRIDEIKFNSGAKSFSVGGYTDQAEVSINSKSPYPVTITSITYELRSTPKGNIQ